MVFKMHAPILAVAVLLSFAVIGLQACSRSCGSNGNHGAIQMGVEADEKVWLFAVDGRKKPYSFMDSEGRLVGFDVDLVENVCSVANKSCKMVLAEFTECAFSSRGFNLAGRGLMSGWFDGCTSYTDSLDRDAAADFTNSYLRTASSFTVAPGNPSRFNPNASDYSNFTLMHLTGAITNERCLTRLGKKFNKVVIAKDLPDAKQILLSGQADVLISPRTKIPDLEVLPNRIHCEKTGAGVMTKKGSQLSVWWNPAFETFVSTGDFDKFCQDAGTKYQRTFKCLSSMPTAPPVLTFKSEEEPADDKTWLFAVSGRRRPFNFMDEQGQLQGFDIDFIKSVCKIAGKRCDAVLAEITECSFTQRNINYPGRGLMDSWFDACTGYANSLDRENSFDFTDAYLKSYATFTVSIGNPSGFDPEMSDYSSFTFTHLTGAYTNAACLERLKKTAKNVIIAANLPDAKEILANRTADVLFSPRGNIPGLETFPQRVHCETTGTSMMAKKGSPLVSWWNQAFATFVSQGGFRHLCQESIKKYAFAIKCLLPEE